MMAGRSWVYVAWLVVCSLHSTDSQFFSYGGDKPTAYTGLDQDDSGKLYQYMDTLYKNSDVGILVVCQAEKDDTEIDVTWKLLAVGCDGDLSFPEYLKKATQWEGTSHGSAADSHRTHGMPDYSNKSADDSHDSVSTDLTTFNYEFQQILQPQRFTCGKKTLHELKDESDEPYYTKGLYVSVDGSSNSYMLKRKRTEKAGKAHVLHRVTTTWKSSRFILMVNVRAVNKEDQFTALLHIEMKGSHGFLPASLYPSLPLEGVIALSYLTISTIWIIVWMRNYKKTIALHIVIGCVAVSGALTHTFMFIQLANANRIGQFAISLHWLAFVLTSIQGSLFVAVLLAVSIGYGITRPKLNKCWIATISVLSVNQLTTSLAHAIAASVLKKAILDSVLVILFVAVMMFNWLWIVIGSIITFIHLLCRKHNTKIKTYGIYMGAGVVVFISIVGLMIGIFIDNCTKWKRQWFVQLIETFGFMHLLIIMWLWRPGDTDQYYAFSPLTNVDEEEEQQDKTPLDFLKMDPL